MAVEHYTHRVRVRYGETDQMGVAHHAVYLTWFEEARTAFLASKGCSYAELERQGWALPVRKVDLRYRLPARYEEELEVEVHVAAARSASITFAYRIARRSPGEEGEDGSILLASGSTELACVRRRGEEMRPCAFPDALRGFIDGVIDRP